MRWLLAALVTVALAIAASVMSLSARNAEPEVTTAPPFAAAERPRATSYAAEFARACRPPCRVHRVEPISPGVWRAHLNFERGYCVLLYLRNFRRTASGAHTGWMTTSCTGHPRERR